MILAAGLGTRLQPLTDTKPKALVPVVNKPCIARVIEYLKGYGIRHIVVNSHHHYQQMLDYLDHGRPFGLDIEVRVEQEILGTGGGIRNTSDFWDDEPFIVINSDILTNIDLKPALDFHRGSGSLATLILHDYAAFNQIRMDSGQNITEISRQKSPGGRAFTGIHIIEPGLLSHIPETGFSDIIECYQRLIRAGESIKGYISRGHTWFDIGSMEPYVKANHALLGPKLFPSGRHCFLDSSAKLEEWAIIGEKTRIENHALIKRSILWDEVIVKPGVKVIDSVVSSFRIVDRDVTAEMI
ncbi:sugar phosphate nucleotidyltransferase [Thermodesulfobacteriota bacterium]